MKTPNSSTIDQFLSGSLDRRTFLKAALGSTSALTLSSLLGCVYSRSDVRPRLSIEQEQTLTSVLDVIFPTTEGTPGAREIQAREYFHFVLLDPRVDASEKKFILSGITWLEKERSSMFDTEFCMLDLEKQQSVVQSVADSDWGEDWLSTLLTYVFEALLSDPLYGGNPNGIGWKWLEHSPGQPRPTVSNAYPKMLL